MSGGHFEYTQDRLCEALFGWDVYIPRHRMNQETEYAEQLQAVRRIDPMHDIELSELVFDILYLIHSLDYWQSGDNGEAEYRKDAQWFKEQWADTPREDRLRFYVDEKIKALKEELEKMIGDYT